MPIDDIEPPEGIKPYIGRKQEGQKRKKQSNGQQEPGSNSFFGNLSYGSLKENVDDVTSFLNIPQAELTPAVIDAIISLMEEIDHLREELNMTHTLENKLSSSVDQHIDLHVLTRHALIRELAIMVARVAQSNTASSFVYFQIANYTEIKNSYGLLASDAMLRDCADILKNHLREIDKVGTLGGDGFGIVMALSDLEQSRKKMDSLKEIIEQGPMIHDGTIIDVKIAYGLCPILAGADTNDILKQADKNRKAT
ncbi:MAG: GGDEF domain-containing protein [Methylocystaceae bacterium]|nr:GGDEF domain-containing protein [Methylocystaceae bacterium]